MSCIKYLLFVFNFFFALSGIAIIVAGALVLADIDDYGHFLENETLAPPIVLIVAGVIVFLIAFLGCCGAIKESYNMLIAFAVLLMIIFIVELAVGIAGAVNKDTFTDELKTAMDTSRGHFQTNKLERTAWTRLQSKLECCGTNGPDDWGNINVPESCCTYQTPNEEDKYCRKSSDPTKVYQEGCFKKLSMRIREGSIIVMGVGIGIALIELTGVVLACLLASAIKKENEEGGGGEKE